MSRLLLLLVSLLVLPPSPVSDSLPFSHSNSPPLSVNPHLLCQHRMRWEGEANEGGAFLKALTIAANLLYRADLVVPQVFVFFRFRPCHQRIYMNILARTHYACGVYTQVLEEGEVVIIDAHRVLWGKVPVADNVDVLR